MTADRDQSIERLLRETRAAEPALPADCPDAETLAAMADDTLPAGLRREIEGHVADCHRCQELTAAMARADVPVGGASAGIAGEPAMWKRRALNWLVPAAAAATAVALWVFVPGQQTPTPTEPTADTQVAATPPALPPPTPEVIVSEPLQLPVEGRADAAARERDQTVETEAPLPRPAAPPPPPPVAAPPPPPLAERALKAEPPAVGGVQAPASVRRNEGALNEGVAVQQDRAAAVQARAASVEVLSPDPQIRWRIGPGLIVQRSTDGGATWIAQQTGPSAQLTAGSAPTPEICWLVGRGGVVLRTTDGGRQWQRVAFPEAVDLTAITASTDRNATVTVADGRRYATDDGITWMEVP